MGKDSLLKSTVKEKTETKKTAPKKTAKTKTVKPKAKAKKTAVPKKPVKKTATKKKKTAAKKAPAVKAKTSRQTKSATAKPKVKKGPAEKLNLKKFDTWRPKKLYQVPADARTTQVGDAPAFVTGKSPEETKRIRALLFKKFELGQLPPEAEIPAESPVEEVPTQPIPPVRKPVVKEQDPAAKMMMYLAIGFIVLIFLIIAASSTNRSNFYLKAADGAVEVWQGTFAPMGSERIIILPGIQAPEVIQSVYTRAEVYQLICNYHLEKADTLIEVSGMPDFEGIKLYLNLAQVYAVTTPLKTAVSSRLNNIDLMTYLYKADVAASKGTVADLQDALMFLNKAAALQLQANQAVLVQSKTIAIQDLIAARKAQQTQAQAAKKPAKPVVEKKAAPAKESEK